MTSTDQGTPARPTVPEAQIAAEIAALKARYRDTRELYREVCGLLFFRYGITPTANMLYQHVRKGSMSTPAQVLARFWSDLRERSRVRIEHPDLPEALRESAGELVLELWSRAQEAAGRGFELQAAEAVEAVREAQARADRAEEDSRLLDERLAAMGGELSAARSQAVDLGRQLATIQGRLASMTEMLRDQAEEMRDLRGELAVSRRDVARAVGETNALRVQLALARRRSARRPLGGVPQDPDPGQENLALDPADAAGTGAPREGINGEAGTTGEEGVTGDVESGSAAGRRRKGP
jgi:hypothetical protein